MSEHTPGRLKAHDTSVYFSNNAGGFDLRFGPSPEANARRLVAAWNACDGLSTEALERLGTLDKARVHLDVLRVQAMEQRDELLAVLKAFSDHVHAEQCATDGAVTYSTTAINHWAFLARAAIAKVEGGQ